MNTTKEREVAQAILERYPMPARIEFLARWATWDLWHGPISSNDESPYNPDPEEINSITWKGFGEACQELDAWVSEIPMLYYTPEFDTLETQEPEGCFIDGTDEWSDPEPYWKLEQKDIKQILFPRELYKYI